MPAPAAVSYSSVQRIWRAHGLKPHLIKTYKVSHNKNFAAKLEGVVGLISIGPTGASADQKSQIQPLDRSQPEYVPVP
jgi:hypothetical protein